MSIYNRMIDVLQSELSATGLDQSSAIAASVAAVENLRLVVGGDNVYFPKRTTLREKRARDHAIRAEFNGRNLHDICRKYRVSRRTVYRACQK